MQQETDEKGILLSLAEEGRLSEKVGEYLESCRAQDGEKPTARGKGGGAHRFPNFAGLCRYTGAGTSELAVLRREAPREYDRLLAVFEDEALNSPLSPTLLSAYMKKRLLYAEEEAEPPSNQVVWCFEHDILADGE